jgi:hypothetical protein
MESIGGSIYAVRLYASGGVVCQRVPRWEVMNVRFALKQLRGGNAACVALDDLHIIKAVWEPKARSISLGNRV